MSIAPVITPPVAPYNNLPIESQNYQPREFVISNITMGVTTLVTTTVDHDYVIGQVVRLLIPQPYGAYPLSGQQGIVIAIPALNEVTVQINSTNADPFIASPTNPGKTSPQIIAIADVNTGQINTGRTGNITYVPGSFINISPSDPI